MAKLTFTQLESFPYQLQIVQLVHNPRKVADSVQPVSRYDYFKMYSPQFFSLFCNLVSKGALITYLLPETYTNCK